MFTDVRGGESTIFQVDRKVRVQLVLPAVVAIAQMRYSGGCFCSIKGKQEIRQPVINILRKFKNKKIQLCQS